VNGRRLKKKVSKEGTGKEIGLACLTEPGDKFI
jgi:hypothetical protein